MLTYRFDVDFVVGVIHTRKVTFTVGAITAFIARTNAAAARVGDLGTLTKVASGGAPVSSATAQEFQRRTRRLHPQRLRHDRDDLAGAGGSVGAETGALSVGVPMLSAKVIVLDDQGVPLPAGALGELAVAGPQIISGYWRNEIATTTPSKTGGYAPAISATSTGTAGTTSSIARRT